MGGSESRLDLVSLEPPVSTYKLYARLLNREEGRGSSADLLHLDRRQTSILVHTSSGSGGCLGLVSLVGLWPDAANLIAVARSSDTPGKQERCAAWPRAQAMSPVTIQPMSKPCGASVDVGAESDGRRGSIARSRGRGVATVSDSDTDRLSSSQCPIVYVRGELSDGGVAGRRFVQCNRVRLRTSLTSTSHHA